MSVFKVNLNNSAQGTLDVNPSTGSQFTTSKQRQVYVMGPNQTNRLLSDGETFTDCNYWKRFAYPQVSLEQAFIEVVSDDGSVYSDDSVDNTYPKVYDVTVAASSEYADNVVDIAGDTGSYAVFTQISNADGGDTVKVRLNGTAIFDLAGGDTQIFNAGDLSVSKIEIADAESGGSGATIQIITSIKSVCNS